jgi:hypothetical protein
MSDPIIEAARLALYGIEERCWDQDDEQKTHIILAAVTPLIRADALEEAALRIEADEEDYLMRMYVAGAIRTLKDKP